MTRDIRDEYFRSDKVALVSWMCNKCINVFASLKDLSVLFYTVQKNVSIHILGLHGQY